MSNLHEEIYLRGRAETYLLVDVSLVFVTIFAVNVLSVLLNFPAVSTLGNNTYPFTICRRNLKT